jgi:drug/metabolite transporter (DMT)-like permease
MVLATLLWGATFVLLRDILVRVSPMALVFTRFATAAGVFALLLAARGRAPGRAALAGGALTGGLTAAGYLFQAIGLRSTTAGTSAFLTCLGTLLAAFFAWALLRQRPGGALLAGLAVAAAGAALMSLDARLRLGPGEAWTLLGAVAFALQIVGVARYAPRADAVALAGVQSAAVALLLWPFAGFPVPALPALAPADAARLGYLVLAGSVLAPLLQIRAQRWLPAGRIGLLFALEPVFALLFALTVGGERFVPRWWAGAALILIGVAGVEWREARAGLPRSSP